MLPVKGVIDLGLAPFVQRVISAGVLIGLATQTLVMTPGSTSGAAAPSASSPFAEPHLARRSLMENRRAMQNAIVIATIVGPCRAFEPHDIR